MKHGRLRVACVLTAGFCMAVAHEIWMLGGDSGPWHSVLTLAAFAAAGLGALVLLLAAGAPGRLWDRLTGRIEAARSWLVAANTPRAPEFGAAIILAGVIAYALLMGRFVPLQTSPERNDQGAFLEAARDVQQTGGVPHLVVQLYGGEFAEANRHPLYIGLLSYVAEFREGKRLSTAMGAATLMLLTLLVARHFDGLTAGVFCVLLATNFTFCYFSSRVVCEILLTFLAGLIWTAALNSDELPRSGPMRFLGIGALLGLAYLTKATALLLALGTVIWLSYVVIRCRESRVGCAHQSGRELSKKRWAQPTLRLTMHLLLVWGFLVAGSPLLVRNVRRFGSPFYNVNSYLLFVDEYRDPQTLADEMSLPEAAGRYWESHRFGQIAGREVRGLVWETFILCRMLGPTPLDDSRAVFGAVLLLFCAVGLLAERNRETSRTLIVIWTILFVATFAWYVPIAAGDRFLVPLLVPLLAYASCGIVRVVGGMRGQIDRVRQAWVLLTGCLAWCVLWVAWTYLSESLSARLL